MGRHLVLVGGGHAHLHTLSRARSIRRRGHRVTLVSPQTYHSYSGMAPGLLGGEYPAEAIRFPLDRLAEQGEVEAVWDRVARIEVSGRRLQLASGATLDYDIASFNIGSDVALDIPPGLMRQVIPVKPVERLEEVRDRIMGWPSGSPCRVTVVGGGAAGVEMAGNLRSLMDRAGVDGRVILVSAGALLDGWPERLVRKVRGNFQRRSIRVVEGKRVSLFAENCLELESGQRVPFDFALVATGVKPPRLFRDSGLSVGPDGALSVNPFLQSLDAPELFGGGDCIHFSTAPLSKVGVYAVREAPVLMHNLVAALEERPLSTYSPQQTFLQILNLGDHKGCLTRLPLSLFGVLPWRIKDRIDRNFMAEYLPN